MGRRQPRKSGVAREDGGGMQQCDRMPAFQLRRMSGSFFVPSWERWARRAFEAVFLRARRSSQASRRVGGGGSVDDCLSRMRTSRKRNHTRRRLPILLSVQRVSRGAEAEKGGLLRLLLVRRCEVSDRATERWMLSSTSTARFTVCGLRLAHGRWREVFCFL